MVRIVIEIIVLLAAHATAGVYSSALKYSKKITYFIWGMWIVFQTILFWHTEVVFTKEMVKFFAGFVLPLIGQYAIFFLTTKGRPAQRVFTILTYSIFFCISMALFSMMKGTFSALHPGVYTVLHAAVLAAIVGYFLRYVCPLCRAAAKNITRGWAQLNLVNIAFLMTVIVASVFPEKLTSFHDEGSITYLFLSISIMAVYPVIFFNINSLSEAAEKREIQRQNRLLLAQIEAENAQIAADSRARHDRRHHNLVMLEFANNNDIDSVRKYLSNLVESEAEICSKASYCEHMTINTVLSAYERRARENGISVSISAGVSRRVDISPQDLVIVIANLFENAINATEKLKNVEKRINISIREKAQRLIIRIENPCREKLAFDESCYGVGLRSVITAVDKYNGMYDFTAEDGVFSAKISLNME